MLKEKIKSIIFFRKKKTTSIPKKRSDTVSKKKGKRTAIEKVKIDTKIQIPSPIFPNERILTAEGWRRLQLKGTVRKK